MEATINTFIFVCTSLILFFVVSLVNREGQRLKL